MKNFKTIILASIIILSNSLARAGRVNDDELSVNYAINIYADAISIGKIDGLDKVLDDNLKYTLEKPDGNLILTKYDAVTFYKKVEGIDQHCQVTVTSQDKTPDVTMVKVYAKYATFTRLNYVTMVNSNHGWKITNIYSVLQLKNDRGQKRRN